MSALKNASYIFAVGEKPAAEYVIPDFLLLFLPAHAIAYKDARLILSQRQALVLIERFANRVSHRNRETQKSLRCELFLIRHAG